MTTELIILFITALFTFVSAIYATNLQNKQNKREIQTELSALIAKGRLDDGRLQQEIETDLWKRVRGEIDHLQAEISEERRDRKSTRLNSSHIPLSRMPSSA